MFEFDPCDRSCDKFFSPPEEKGGGGQITQKHNIVHSTSFPLEIQNQKVGELMTYFIDQQIFKFEATIGHKEPRKPPILTN